METRQNNNARGARDLEEIEEGIVPGFWPQPLISPVYIVFCWPGICHDRNVHSFMNVHTVEFTKAIIVMVGAMEKVSCVRGGCSINALIMNLAVHLVLVGQTKQLGASRSKR